MPFWNEKSSAYEALDSQDEEIDSPRTKTTSPRYGRLSRLSILILIIVVQSFALISTSVASYAFGKMRSQQTSDLMFADFKSQSIGESKVRTEKTLLTYNRTYAEHPSPETDAAWEAIFPPHGGFFHDDQLAPTGASLAVYHQLHCLDAIRHAYYVLFDAVMEGHNVTFSELEDYSTDWHTRHCLDFLRQMLMCNADLNIEAVDPHLGGIRGFGDGREHQCVVWEDVRNWSIAQQ